MRTFQVDVILVRDRQDVVALVRLDRLDQPSLGVLEVHLDPAPPSASTNDARRTTNTPTHPVPGSGRTIPSCRATAAERERQHTDAHRRTQAADRERTAAGVEPRRRLRWWARPSGGAAMGGPGEVLKRAEESACWGWHGGWREDGRCRRKRLGAEDAPDAMCVSHAPAPSSTGTRPPPSRLNIYCKDTDPAAQLRSLAIAHPRTSTNSESNPSSSALSPDDPGRYAPTPLLSLRVHPIRPLHICSNNIHSSVPSHSARLGRGTTARFRATAVSRRECSTRKPFT